MARAQFPTAPDPYSEKCPADETKNPQQETAQTSNESKIDSGIRWTDKAMVLFTGVLTLVACLQIWIICRTLKETTKAANAAKQAADVAEKSLASGSRGYVILTSARFERTDPDMIIATLQNVGKTTASANIEGGFYGASHLIRSSVPGRLGEIPHMRHAEMIIRPVKPFTPDEMKSIHDNKIVFGFFLWSCWKTNKLYDEQAYMKALELRGSPLLASASKARVEREEREKAKGKKVA
jgi:hypothetical protein